MVNPELLNLAARVVHLSRSGCVGDVLNCNGEVLAAGVLDVLAFDVIILASLKGDFVRNVVVDAILFVEIVSPPNPRAS